MNPSISLASAPKRRNGRPQACEPCRRRKVACDHRTPTCSRCRRGGIADNSRPQPLQAHLPEGNIGYLGATSFSAFYEEAQQSLPVADKCESEAEAVLPPKCVEVFPGMGEAALSVLRQIPDKASSKLLARLYSSFYGGWSWLSGQWLNESLWTAFGTTLDREARDEAQLRRMSSKLYRNGAVPLGEAHADAQAWFDEYSGPNLRWEALGLLFVFWAGGARRLPERSAICGDCAVLHNHHASQLVRQYKTAAWKCIELCRDGASSNMLLAFLVLGHSLLESNISGDAGMQYWRTHGDLMAMTTYLGLHVSPNADPMDCTITTQVKRQLFAAIFAHDKVTATFTGRPPFLSRRFSSTPLPLDLSDDMLLLSSGGSSSNQLADYRDCRVDDNGWSTDGRIYVTTTLRARAMLAYVRDEILEIALQSLDFGGKSALLNLKRREMQIVAGFPPCILYQPEDVNNPDISGRDLYARLLVWLEHLQNLFLIERLLSKLQQDEDNSQEAPSSSSSSRLFDISLEMVTLAHLFWTHQNRLKTVEDCVEWTTASFAAPAGGVLCMELLRGTATHDALSPAATKALIAEKLGMLAAFLDWVGPGSPNYDICYRVKRVVRRVLEQALEMPVQTNLLDGSGHWSMEDGEGDLNSFFSFDLLDTFEWLRPE
ncbi:fungal-specific transcription factor domain-containing protein [Trichoderma citrinoviride]|uniref:Fungal-specific transcription factor domain-containing protein n=1 Tax=Trichoderma citrinoviride TaxID=58853 RepID=A0A2T4B199_9HYPO|nr:fungal-specific transcription factor domain-containing protein [Trichoderma citrinoviride]PTB63102.1 fungal-specific transcription factor domain-containing protein [Trichoderma citrinoviride]